MARRVSVLDDSWLVHDGWLAKQSDQPFCKDALAHLHWIQHALSIPIPVRQAGERMRTAVIRNDSTPLRTDPIGHAGINVIYLSPNLPLRAGQSLASLLGISSRYQFVAAAN